MTPPPDPTAGLPAGRGALLEGEGPGLCPPFLRQVMAAALKTGECNACMKRIVAAPHRRFQRGAAGGAAPSPGQGRPDR